MKIELTKEQVIKIIEEELPKIIERHPEVKAKLVEVLEEKMATKEDIKMLIEQIEKNRQESNKRFEQLIKEMNKRFEEINQRFEEMREDTNKRFEETNERFEQLIKEMNKRFEEVNRRFEEMRKDTDKRFEEIRKEFNERFEQLTKGMRDGFKKLSDTISAVGSRWSIFSERAFRDAMSDLLKKLGLDKAEKWVELDEEGIVFGHPSMVEVDLLIKNNVHYLIEVKSSVSEGDAIKLKNIGELYEKKTKVKPQLVFVTPFMREKAKILCKKYGIKYYVGIVEPEEEG